jgi:hypothetical protein
VKHQKQARVFQISYYTIFTRRNHEKLVEC